MAGYEQYSVLTDMTMMMEEGDESEPFVVQPFASEVDEKGRFEATKSWRWSPKVFEWIVIFLLSIICVALIGCLLLRDYRFQLSREALSLQSSYSPARNAIEYQWQNGFEQSNWFRGVPGPEDERQWRRIMSSTYVRLTKDELDRAGEPGSVRLKDGDYGARLAVAHQLYCVKRVKEFMYADFVHPEIRLVHGNPEYDQLRKDADYCLDMLRQHVMCSVDPTVMRLEYNALSKRSHMPAVLQQAPRVCVNWDKLSGWMEEHATSSIDFIEPDDWDSLNDSSLEYDMHERF